MTVTALPGGWVSIIDENLEKPLRSEKHLFRTEEVTRVAYDGGFSVKLPDGSETVQPPCTVIWFRSG